MFPEVSLVRLGFSVDRQSQLQQLQELENNPTLVAGRIAVEHRGGYGLLGCPATAAQLAGRLRHAGLPPTDWPAVGDWVVVQLPADPASGPGIIQHVLPRTSVLQRRRPGSNHAQVVAANVDVVFVVTAPGQDFSLRRIERYLAAILAGGARPAIVLNKADLADQVDQVDHFDQPWDLVQSVAAGASCLLTSAATGAGLDLLRAQLPTGSTGVMVGSSGVGKSSLLNRLLGEARQETTLVRLIDDKGRHTTTRRELIEVPEAGMMIDTPGMREFGLWEAGEGIEQTFDEVAAVAQGCRFRDCRHQGEPGCAVARAVAEGQLPEDRLASLDKLRREEAYLERTRDPRMQARSKARWKAIHKQHRARRQVDPKLRDD